MSSIRRGRKGYLPAFLLAGFFMLTLGRGAAWAGSRGGHGGHGGRSGGGNRIEGVPFGDFGNFRFAVGGHRTDRRRFDGVGFGPLYDVPYYDSYVEDDYERGPRESHGRPTGGASHSGYCDVSPHSYPQNCVWKDGP